MVAGFEFVVQTQLMISIVSLVETLGVFKDFILRDGRAVIVLKLVGVPKWLVHHQVAQRQRILRGD